MNRTEQPKWISYLYRVIEWAVCVCACMLRTHSTGHWPDDDDDMNSVYTSHFARHLSLINNIIIVFKEYRSAFDSPMAGRGLRFTLMNEHVLVSNTFAFASFSAAPMRNIYFAIRQIEPCERVLGATARMPFQIWTPMAIVELCNIHASSFQTWGMPAI